MPLINRVCDIQQWQYVFLDDIRRLVKHEDWVTLQYIQDRARDLGQELRHIKRISKPFVFVPQRVRLTGR